MVKCISDRPIYICTYVQYVRTYKSKAKAMKKEIKFHYAHADGFSRRSKAKCHFLFDLKIFQNLFVVGTGWEAFKSVAAHLFEHVASTCAFTASE